jgi:hypothetical protein
MIRSGAYQNAWKTIEDASLSQGHLRRHYLIARILDMVNSGGDEWSRVLQFIIELEKLCGEESGDLLAAIRAWNEFADSMRLACQSKKGANSDPVGHCCGRGGATPNPINALRLIGIRLTWAESMDSPLLATQTILTLPEALIQLYCAAKLQLNYWAPPPLDNSALAEIRKLPRKVDFEWPLPDRSLSFNHLLTLGWLKMQDLPTADRLTQDYASLDQLQQLYAQDRNPLSHHLTFSNKKQWQRYASECRRLFAKVADILLPVSQRPHADLPPLDVLLDAAPFPQNPTAVDPFPPSAVAPVTTPRDPGQILGLFYYKEGRSLSGGMSGSSVNLVEYQESKNTELRLGILKVTTKKADYERERVGSRDAQDCWLRNHVAFHCKSKPDGNSYYLLSPLAFKATDKREIENLHDLLVKGEQRTRALGAFSRLGDLYGSNLDAAQRESGTAQEHFRRIWEHWREAAVGFEWAKWQFPGREDDLFADGRQNWVNPIACLEDKTKWNRDDTISLGWGWQHRDLNLRNVLIPPEGAAKTPKTPTFLFIDLEKVSQSSALMDLCWASLWALQAGEERAGVRDSTWDLLPEAFLHRTLSVLDDGTRNSEDADLCAFEYSVSCVSEALRAFRAAATSVGDPVISRDQYAITLSAASLAKAFYELRDLQRAKDIGKLDLRERWQRARCFFRISARSLAPFLKNPQGPPKIDLSAIPDSVTTTAK